MAYQQSTALKWEKLSEVSPALKADALSDEEAEHFKTLCHELSATILEQHSKLLQRGGAVRMSFEFPHNGSDAVMLTVQNGTLTIGRCIKHQRNSFTDAAPI
ncbi:hypothetical protein N9W34_00385 [Rickettsiales bacterium]|nr:hypothetical protein [Rickettsiales bacterium]